MWDILCFRTSLLWYSKCICLTSACTMHLCSCHSYHLEFPSFFVFLDLNQLKFYLPFKAHLCHFLCESFPVFLNVISPFFEMFYNLCLSFGPYHVTLPLTYILWERACKGCKEKNSCWIKLNMNDVFFIHFVYLSYFSYLSSHYKFPEGTSDQTQRLEIFEAFN